MERTKMPNLRNGTKWGFEPGPTWLRVRHSTAELPRSINHLCSGQCHSGALAMLSTYTGVNRMKMMLHSTTRIMTFLRKWRIALDCLLMTPNYTERWRQILTVYRYKRTLTTLKNGLVNGSLNSNQRRPWESETNTQSITTLWPQRTER